MPHVITPSTPIWVRLLRIMLTLVLGTIGCIPVVWMVFYGLPVTTINLVWACLVEVICLLGLLVVHLDQRR